LHLQLQLELQVAVAGATCNFGDFRSLTSELNAPSSVTEQLPKSLLGKGEDGSMIMEPSSPLPSKLLGLGHDE